MVEISLSQIIWIIVAFIGFIIVFVMVVYLTKNQALSNFVVGICKLIIPGEICENFLGV